MKKLIICLIGAAVLTLLSPHSYAILPPPGGGGHWVLPLDPGGDNNPGGNPPGGSASVVPDNSIKATDSKDMKDMKSIVTYPTNDGYWDIFTNGTGYYNDVGRTNDPSHFYSTSEAGHLGAEYHFPADWSVGLSLGYTHTDANFGNINNSATRDSYGSTLFASYAHNGWFADGNITGAYDTFTQDLGTPTGIAHGATDGSQYGAHLDGGYLFHSGDLSFGPMLGLTYGQESTHSFNEGGAGTSDLSFTNSNSSSTLSYLGGVIRYQAQIGSLSVLPYLTLGWQHEFLNASETVNGTVISSGAAFNVSSPLVDRDSAVIHLGANAEVTDKITVFVDYSNQVNATFVDQSLNGGVTFSF
jgi:outer membrane autotransporter protein